MLSKPDFLLPDAQRYSIDAKRYDRLFRGYQAPAKLQSVSDPHLRLLERVSGRAVAKLPTERHVAELDADLAEMQRRGMAEDEDYVDLYRALITSRQFAMAEVLAKKHPAMDGGIAPALLDSGVLPKRWPTALSVDAQGRTMSREAFDLSPALRVVIVASCHFSEDAARAIASDAQLRPVFAQHAIWLASQAESFQSVTDWN